MDQIINELIKTVIDAAVVTIIPLVVAFIVQQIRKTGLEISAQSQARLQVIAENAVLAVEEWAADRVKRAIPTANSQKYARALEIVLEKVPGISEDEAHDLIHAALPKVGVGATDFLAKVREAATNPSK